MKAERRLLSKGWEEEQIEAPTALEFISRVLTQALGVNRRIEAGGKRFAQLRSPGPNMTRSTCLSSDAKESEQMFN